MVLRQIVDMKNGASSLLSLPFTESPLDSASTFYVSVGPRTRALGVTHS